MPPPNRLLLNRFAVIAFTRRLNGGAISITGTSDWIGSVLWDVGGRLKGET